MLIPGPSNRRVRAALALIGILLLASTAKAGETVRAAAAPDGQTLTLEDGRTLRLAGIEAALPPAGSPPERTWPLAQSAAKRLSDLAMGRALILSDTGTDRYGRILAHAFADGGVWLQAALLTDGLARVRTTPDDRARAAVMLLIEAEARAARRGIWATRPYAVRDAADTATLSRDSSSFQIVTGRVRRAEKHAEAVYIDFDEDWRTDTTARLDREAQRRFAAAGVDPLRLSGTVVRLRGWVESYNGPLIRITHPEQIERDP